jgi:hypothetical protein
MNKNNEKQVPNLEEMDEREAEATYPKDTEARRRAKEDAAIDAEGILAQAEEANALDSVG